MDFKALMAAQIAKAKTPTTAASTTSKYQRRSEQEAAREAAYIAEQKRLEAEKQQRAVKKRKVEEQEAAENVAREEKRRKLAEESKAKREVEEREQEVLRRKRLGLPALVEQKDEDDGALAVGEVDIQEEELQTRLREIGEPAILFDENHPARLRRYYKVTAVAKRKRYDRGPISTSLEPVEAQDMLLPTELPAKESAEYQFLHRQIGSYFTLLLSEWKTDLANRPADVKQSQSGKAAESTYYSVLRDLTPFYRKLETRTIPSDLLTPIISIARNAQKRRYVDANDDYLRLSIGKAAWPIGVTMVGIHERSAREKIHEGDNTAHIMADEVTRKMLQSVKRCLSYAQTRWPPEDIGQLMG